MDWTAETYAERLRKQMPEEFSAVEKARLAEMTALAWVRNAMAIGRTDAERVAEITAILAGLDLFQATR